MGNEEGEKWKVLLSEGEWVGMKMMAMEAGWDYDVWGVVRRLPHTGKFKSAHAHIVLSVIRPSI